MRFREKGWGAAGHLAGVANQELRVSRMQAHYIDFGKPKNQADEKMHAAHPDCRPVSSFIPTI
jgi:hypothetical protein